MERRQKSSDSKPPEKPKKKPQTPSSRNALKDDMKVVLQTLGMGDLLNSEDIDIDKVLELAEVVQEYMIAAEDKNLGLKTLKKKQFKQLYKELFS